MAKQSANTQVVFTTEKVDEIRKKVEEGYKITRQEKYWSENYLLTKKDGIVFHLSDEETMEYIKCKLGVDVDGNPYMNPATQKMGMIGIEYFARNYCKIKNEMGKVGLVNLRDYQVDVLNMFMENQNSILLASRQVGKTIMSSITILYYCIFERNKNILIAGNISKTAEEILNKIKDIYYLLPFWLKPTTRMWNVHDITFGDTKCRIKTTATTKTSAIGNAVDFLYLDEFAHVDDGIANDFYRSIYPTTSAIKNSKIIITSTPNGYNLFWKLLSNAEKKQGDPEKNTFIAKRVYWYHIPSRFVTYLRLNEYELGKNNINADDLYHWVKSLGFAEEEVVDGKVVKEGIKMIKNYETDKKEIHIPNKLDKLPEWIKKELVDKEWENPVSDFFRTRRIHFEEGEGETEKKWNVSLMELCDVSSWKEDAVKDIGSLEAFNQEYDLQPLSGSKMVLDSSIMSKIENSIHDFEYINIPKINEKIYVPYDNLRWIKGRPDLFNMVDIKKYYLTFSVDISEGLNGDYSVINIFRNLPKPEEDWSINITSLVDFFKLEQIGIFHSNITSVQDLAELLYMLVFEICDDSKVGVVIESNNWGGELTKTMREIFQGRSRYGTHVFFRYKHRVDALIPEIGIKLRQNKNMFVKDYQQRIRQGDILIHHQETLQEMTKFIKKNTTTGYTFQAESGSHDDITMTVVEVATVFENNLFKDIVGRFISELPVEYRNGVDKRLREAPASTSTDYSSLFAAKRLANNKRMGQELLSNPYMGTGSVLDSLINQSKTNYGKDIPNPFKGFSG